MNATSKVTPGFIPTKKVSFPKDGFFTVRTNAFSNDGWHSIPLEMLCNDYVDEGGELGAFIFEASGGNDIDYDAVLKCHVVDGVVKSVYTPGIMGGDGKLFLVSGDNQFEIFLSDTLEFELGSLRGKLQEKEYKRADGTDGKSVSVLFTPQNNNLKVVYEIPFIIRKWDELKKLLEDGAEISKELFDWLLSQPEGLKVISSFLMQSFGGSDRKKLYELGLGRWRVIEWKRLEQSATSTYPPRHLIKVETFDGEELPGEFYTNKSLTDSLNSMGAFFLAQKANGRDIQLLISDIRPYNDSFAVTAGIQIAPQIVNQGMMRSAAVGQNQLPQAKTPASKTAEEFMQRLNPIEVTVNVSATENIEANLPTSRSIDEVLSATPTAVVADDSEYDPIPF